MYSISVALATGITWAISVICMGIDILGILFTTCTLYPDRIKTYPTNYDQFLQHHLDYLKCSDGSNVTWWNKTETGCIAVHDEAPNKFTNSKNTFIYIIIHLCLHFFWAISAFGLASKNQSMKLRWPWMIITGIILMYSLVISAFFIKDLVVAVECIDEDPDSWRIQMVFPIYFSYGIIFWISILFVWGLELFNYCSNSNQPNSEVPSSRKAKSNIRSLSEAKSEDISDKINKRFDRAEAIEDYDSRSGSNDTLVKRNSAFTKPPAYNQIPASSSANTGEWVYANPGFVQESSPEVYATPQSFGLSRLLSQENNTSKTGSKNNNTNRPESMPPLPRVDYPIPRANVSASMSNQMVAQNSRKKVIRTPSGKNYSATEYLRGGYLPNQTVLTEEIGGGTY